MIKRNWFWSIGGVILTIAIIFGVKQLLYPETAQVLTEEEIQTVVEQRYTGQILNIERDEQQYLVDLERETGIYKVKLDVHTAEIISLTKIKDSEPIREDKEAEQQRLTENEIEMIIMENSEGELKSIKLVTIQGEQVYQATVKQGNKQTTLTVDSVTGELITTESETITDPPKRLTEQEAGQIALKEVQGEIDDIDLENVGGVAYYYVDIETPNGHDAVIEINAITGEVKSLKWDEED